MALRGLFGPRVPLLHPPLAVDEAIEGDMILRRWLEDPTKSQSNLSKKTTFEIVDALVFEDGIRRYVLQQSVGIGDNPLKRNTVIMTLTQMLDQMIDFNLQKLQIFVLDGDVVVHPLGLQYVSPSETSFDRIESEIVIFDRSFRLQLIPIGENEWLPAVGNLEVELLLTFGLAVAAMILAYQVGMQKDRAQVAEKLNIQLE